MTTKTTNPLNKLKPQSITCAMKSSASIPYTRVLTGLWLCGMITFIPSVSAQTTVVLDGFETEQSLNDWVADNSIWEIGEPTSGPPTNAFGLRAHEGTNCLATILGGDYTDDRISRVVSPAIVVPVDNPRLRFWHWWSFGHFDIGRVEISTDGEVGWEDLSPQYSATSSGIWTRPSLDLTAYAGQTVRIGFYFESHTHTVSSGWYVDEVTLLHDFAQLLLDSPVVRT